MSEIYGTRPYHASPRARRKAQELGVSVEEIAGSSPSGHVIEGDVITYFKLKNKSEGPELPQNINSLLMRKATPLAQRIAEVENISLTSIKGTGIDGKITSEDVRQLINKDKNKNQTIESHFPVMKPFVGMRKIIAERMQASAQTVPHVTLTTEVDVTDLVSLREELVKKAEREIGVRVTFTDLIVKASASAIKQHPKINVSLEKEYIAFHTDINIGIAVAIDDGLIVPVIKSIDKKSIYDVAKESKILIERARNGRLQTEDIQNGRFTVSNLGTYEIDAFTPIINPPESAILGVGRIVEKLVVKDGTIRIRNTMILSLSFDHRVMDGAPAAAFLQNIKWNLENPTSDWM
jgi:pyruvate dehydrogenase E2 component (dihydrolipoamide acetyltransferase)